MQDLVQDTDVTNTMHLPELVLPANTSCHELVRSLANHWDTPHVAVFSEHRLVAATKDWMSLDIRDQTTLSLYLRSLSPSSARDIPTFLPHSTMSGDHANGPGWTPFRLLTVALQACENYESALSRNECRGGYLQLVAICGPQPALSTAVANVVTLCQENPELQPRLRNCVDMYRGLPPTLKFQPFVRR